MSYIVPDRNKDIGEFEEKADDNMIICRCEEITKGEIRKAIHQGLYTMNEIKRFLRPGMGLCQGLTCGRNVKALIAAELKISPSELEESTSRPPARPVAAWVYGDERES